MTKNDKHKKIVAFDFFCGCGGTSRGFQNVGIDIAFALDTDLDVKSTFTMNFPKTTFCSKSITKLTASDLQPTIDKHKDSYNCFADVPPANRSPSKIRKALNVTHARAYCPSSALS